MTDELIVRDDGPLRRIVMNRPAARNALTMAMYDGIAAACREVAEDGPIRAVILSGAGERAFAAGTDMAQFRSFDGPADALAYERKMDAVLSDIERCPVPTIAAITGACTGGGAMLSAVCDLRIADRRLKWGFPIARTLGNCLSVGNLHRLGHLVGFARLREILFTARLIEADEAAQIGLVAELLEDPGAVMARADALAETLAGHAPLTLRATKEALRRIMRAGAAADGDDLVALCYTSADFKEGIEAFLGKRAPAWLGR
ncbi:MAG: enoyl-CoA hydratase/isomerase family protein [Paracoccaceae bacterium]